MRTFVIGDIHGAHIALKQVFERAQFDFENDTLIALGDVADGWTDIAECFEELFKVKNLIYIRGNHDQWLKDYFLHGERPRVWTMQGGQNTLASYEKHQELIESHKAFLKKSVFYYVPIKQVFDYLLDKSITRKGGIFVYKSLPTPVKAWGVC